MRLVRCVGRAPLDPVRYVTSKHPTKTKVLTVMKRPAAVHVIIHPHQVVGESVINLTKTCDEVFGEWVINVTKICDKKI